VTARTRAGAGRVGRRSSDAVAFDGPCTTPVRSHALQEGSPSLAYGARLESVLGVTSLGGSNPPPSATETPPDLRRRPGPWAGASAYRDGRSPDWSQIGHRMARAAGAELSRGPRASNGVVSSADHEQLADSGQAEHLGRAGAHTVAARSRMAPVEATDRRCVRGQDPVDEVPELPVKIVP
jgi:hypothetical protein